MIPVALALSLLVGVSLGLLGGGGSILAVPILVYVAGVPAQAAIPMSLVVVGLVSALGTLLYARLGLVRLRAALVFGCAGIVGALLGARLTQRVSERWLLTLFAMLMLIVAVSMARKRREPVALDRFEPRLAAMVAVGFGVGGLTGFLGVGGGFVIVPALLWAGRLPMKDAIGTSLATIALNSTSGLLGHLGQAQIDWRLTAEFVACAGAGMFVGQLGARRLRAERLRQAFAALVAAVGLVILLRQASLLGAAGISP